MPLRVATFNVENLMNRFDFSGFRNDLHQDRTLSLYKIRDEAEYRRLEEARTIAHTDDTRQLTALAIAATRADILCLQEVDNIDALKAFEYAYLFKMVGEGYREKYMSEGNDGRGIDVALVMRRETMDGEPIEFVRMTSHAGVTFDEFGLYGPEFDGSYIQPQDRIFRRDCLEIDLTVAGKPLTIYLLHLKSMTGARDGENGRGASMPLRMAEARAARRIIENRFGADRAADMNWLICGDMNDYRERVVISGDMHAGYEFAVAHEQSSAINVFTEGGFCENVVERRPEMDRWTLYHTRGPQERHLCQLDYIFVSRGLARQNPDATPDIVRSGQPFRTVFPPGQEVERFPRVGWDRPKASDHCPVAVTLKIA